MGMGSEQLGFEGFASAEPTDRLFFAIMPDTRTAEAIAGAAERSRRMHGLSAAPLRTDRFHVTLIHIGDFAGLPQAVVADSLRVGEDTAAAPFDVTFDRAASFSGAPQRKPFVLQGGAGLDDLQTFRRSLWDRLIRAGVKPLSRIEFNPHVTLLYDPASIAEHPVEPVRWTVDEFLLIHSELGRTKYNILGRWPLTADR